MPPHVIVPLAGIAVPMVVVPTVMVARHMGRKQRFRHLERMRALGSGVAPPSNVPIPGPGSVVAIGAGVPTACVLGATAATLAVLVVLEKREEAAMIALAIVWSASVLLGLCALATGLVLGLLLHRAEAKASAAIRDASAKPTYDPDMFEAAAHDFR